MEFNVPLNGVNMSDTAVHMDQYPCMCAHISCSAHLRQRRACECKVGGGDNVFASSMSTISSSHVALSKKS